MRSFFCLFLLAFFVFPLFVQPAYAQAHNVPGKIIVKFKPGVMSLPKGVRSASANEALVKAASIQALNAAAGVFEIKQVYKEALKIRPDWTHLADNYVISFPQNRTVEAIVREYKKDANVLSASPVAAVRAFDTVPNDPGLSSQYGLTNIMATSGWDRTTGSSAVIIAVIDTGVDYNHVDLAGKVDTVRMKDFFNDDDDAWDDNGHGTEVSGVIGAITNNGVGVAGMDWQAKILPLKVLDSTGSGNDLAITEALQYVAALKSVGVNIVVVNMSLGQSLDKDYLQQACDDAYALGIVLVAAAGNANSSAFAYPAYYDSVLAVGAVDSSDHRSVWNFAEASNYGSWVDVAAPGTQIYSTYPGNNYSYSNGTSLASPFVAGLASLVKATDSSLTPRQIMDKITSEADAISTDQPIGKRINASYVLSRTIAGISSPANGACVRGTVSVQGTAAGSNFTDYRLEVLSAEALVSTVESSALPVSSGLLGNWDTTGLAGQYTLLLAVGSSSSGSQEVSAEVVVDNVDPIAQISTPTGVDAVSGAITISGTGFDQYLDYYTLEYGVGSAPTSFEEILTAYVSVSGETLGTWTTDGLNGTYLLRLRVVDRAGATSTDSVALTIVNLTDPTKAAVASAGLPLTYPVPNPFDLNVTAECSLNYILTGNFDTKIYLFDFAGKLMWQQTFPAGTNGGKSGSNNPAWNGLDLAGARVDKGLYFYQVVADGKVIARGKIILLN